MTEPSSVTTTIVDPGRDMITMINVFTIKPENQQQFIAAQTGEYKRLAGTITGGLAANLHRGLGGARAVNYALFRSVEEMHTWQNSDLMKAHLPIIKPFIERAEPGLYRVIDVVSRAGRVARIEAGPDQLALVAVLFARDATPEALDALVAGQRDAATRLLDAIPALRSLTLHRGIRDPRAGVIGPAGQSVVRASSPDLALYAQIDTPDVAHALLEHPLYRAWFTTEHAHIGRAEQEVYEVAYVQNEAAPRALQQ
jgi:hypothetical protein